MLKLLLRVRRHDSAVYHGVESWRYFLRHRRSHPERPGFYDSLRYEWFWTSESFTEWQNRLPFRRTINGVMALQDKDLDPQDRALMDFHRRMREWYRSEKLRSIPWYRGIGIPADLFLKMKMAAAQVSNVWN